MKLKTVFMAKLSHQNAILFRCSLLQNSSNTHKCSSSPLTQIELEQPVGGDERLATLHPLAAAPHPHPTVPAAASQPSTAPVQAAHGVAVGRHSRAQPSHNTHIFQGIKYLAVQAAYGVAVGRHSRSQPSYNIHIF